MRKHCSKCPVQPNLFCVGEQAPAICNKADEPEWKSYLISTSVSVHPETKSLGGNSPSNIFVRRRPNLPALSIVGVTLGCGGAEVWHLEIAKLMASCRSIDFMGSAFSEKFDQNEVFPKLQGTGPVHIGLPAVLDAFSKSDIIICWGLNGISDIMQQTQSHAKVILVSHGSGKWTERIFKEAPDSVIAAAVSEKSTEPIPPSLGEPRVIANAIDPSRITPFPNSRATLGLPEDKPIIGWVGRFSIEKNPIPFALAAPLSPGAHLAMFGGAIDQNLVPVPKTPNLTIHPYTDSRVIYSTIDALVVTSHEEGCSLVTLEAWLAGIPVISTPVGIVPDNRSWVFLLPPTPLSSDVAAAIDHFLAHRSEAALRAERARRGAGAEYGLDVFQREWLEFVKEVAATITTNKYVHDSKINAKISSCEYRGARIGCGCQQTWECKAGKGKRISPDKVYISECVECVTRAQGS